MKASTITIIVVAGSLCAIGAMTGSPGAKKAPPLSAQTLPASEESRQLDANESAPTIPIDNSWADEKARVKSDLVQAYENAAEPLDQKIAMANVYLQCRLRSGSWYGETVDALEASRLEPPLGLLTQRMNRDELGQAYTFDRMVAKGTTTVELGDPVDLKTNCPRIRSMPIASSDATLLP